MVLAEAVGEVRLSFDDRRHLVLSDCFYVPSFKRNLISVACLINDNSVSYTHLTLPTNREV